MSNSIKNWSIELHDWYLKACKHLNPDNYNVKAQKSWDELSKDQKYIDEYIAKKFLFKFQRLVKMHHNCTDYHMVNGVKWTCLDVILSLLQCEIVICEECKMNEVVARCEKGMYLCSDCERMHHSYGHKTEPFNPFKLPYLQGEDVKGNPADSELQRPSSPDILNSHIGKGRN